MALSRRELFRKAARFAVALPFMGLTGLLTAPAAKPDLGSLDTNAKFAEDARQVSLARNVTGDGLEAGSIAVDKLADNALLTPDLVARETLIRMKANWLLAEADLLK